MAASKPLALKFISGKYQGGEFPLKLEKQIVIGRSSELDVVLAEDMVSRKHAKISTQGGKVVIEDLGSTNGTFVNGEKIRQARLKEGDRILIGTSILRLVSQGNNAPEVDEREARRKLEQAAAAHAAQSSGKPSLMAGSIQEIPLPDLLQLFHTAKKTGVLIVRHAQEGKIYLKQGRIYYAVIGDNHALGPDKSFNRLLTWEVADFELRPAEPQSFPVELDSSTEALLMNAIRLLDEYRRIEKQLPPPGAPLKLPSPMVAPMRDLTPELLDVLQLAHNWGNLRGVLDHSEKADAVVAESLIWLIQKEYIRVGS
jgi:FHA domain/Domain of unknown function (DUF4388)